MSYRDPEFLESLEGFVAVSALDKNKKLPKEQVSIGFCIRREALLIYDPENEGCHYSVRPEESTFRRLLTSC